MCFYHIISHQTNVWMHCLQEHTEEERVQFHTWLCETDTILAHVISGTVGGPTLCHSSRCSTLWLHSCQLILSYNYLLFCFLLNYYLAEYKYTIRPTLQTK